MDNEFLFSGMMARQKLINSIFPTNTNSFAASLRVMLVYFVILKMLASLRVMLGLVFGNEGLYKQPKSDDHIQPKSDDHKEGVTISVKKDRIKKLERLTVMIILI